MDPKVVPLLSDLYRQEWRRFHDFFCPSVKLLSKERIGSAIEATELSVEAIEDLLSVVKISYHTRDYGILKEAIPKLVEGGMKFARLFIPNPKDLSEQDVRSIYEEAY